MSAPHDLWALVERLTDVLGPPVRDPDLALYRWRCPVCGGGYDDELGLYRPLVVSDDGWVVCRASLPRGLADDESCRFTIARLAAALKRLEGVGRHE